jgi:hypothetical protein
MRNDFTFNNSIYFIVVFIVTTISIFLIGISSNQSHIINALKEQPQVNLTSTEKQQTLNGISFQIENVTFSHHMATVNGIQLHYVMGGKGEPVVLLHGWPETWY